MTWRGAIGSVPLPVVTVPTGLTRQSLPVGIQVVGLFLSDAKSWSRSRRSAAVSAGCLRRCDDWSGCLGATDDCDLRHRAQARLRRR
jgi:hypothetical protein